MIKVLFVCVHNAARSQMAEAFLNRIGAGRFVAESAGLEAGVLNPLVVEAMAELGYDLSQNQTKSVFDFYRAGRIYHHVIKVCDELNGQRCPIFPGTRSVRSWSFEDPSQFEGTHDEKLEKVRALRDRIKANVERLVDEQALIGLDAVPSDRRGNMHQEASDLRVYRIDGLNGLRHAQSQDLDVRVGLSGPGFELFDSGVITAAELIMANLGEAWLAQLHQPHLLSHQLLAFVEEVRDQMAPGTKGIRSMDAFIEGLHRTAAVRGLNIRSQVRSVVGPLDVRPPLSPLISYIEKSFERNQPLVWLRASEATPWSLVVGARIHPYSESIQFEIVEKGTLSWVDFTAWVKHDPIGGGLLSMVIE